MTVDNGDPRLCACKDSACHREFKFPDAVIRWCTNCGSIGFCIGNVDSGVFRWASPLKPMNDELERVKAHNARLDVELERRQNMSKAEAARDMQRRYSRYGDIGQQVNKLLADSTVTRQEAIDIIAGNILVGTVNAYSAEPKAKIRDAAVDAVYGLLNSVEYVRAQQRKAGLL